MSTRDEHKQWFDAKFPPQSVSRDDEREYVLRRFYDNDVLVTMTFLDDGKTADLFIPASHRAAVAAALLAPPAPGVVAFDPGVEGERSIVAVPPAPGEVRIDRETALLLHWAMHDLDRRTFSCAAEDHRSILTARADELRDKLRVALAAAGQEQAR